MKSSEAALPQSDLERASRVKTAIILITMSSVMFAPLVYSAVVREIPLLTNLGFDPDALAPAAAWIGAGLIALAYILYTFWAVPEVRQRWRELSLLKLIGIAAAFASGIMEEIVFRRWLMDMLERREVAVITQVAISGVVFGFAHLSWRLFDRNWRSTVFGVISTIVLGCALGCLYVFAGRDIGPCIATHVAINLIIEPWLVLAAVAGQRAAPAAP